MNGAQTAEVSPGSGGARATCHQAVGPHGNARLQRLLGQQIEIDLVIAILKEDSLAPVAALCNVMREPRNHDSSQSSHTRTIALREGIGIMSPYFSLFLPCR
jgi:hypothetical protein